MSFEIPDRPRDEDLRRPPPEVFTTDDLPIVSLHQVGKSKELVWKSKKKRKVRGRRR